MNSNKNDKLHTIKTSFSGDPKKPICEKFYGDDKPDDWPIEVHSGLRLTKTRETTFHSQAVKEKSH